MGDGRTPAIARLTKFDVERLLAEFDTEPVAALTAALQRVLDRPGDRWEQLLDLAPLTHDRRRRLLAADAAACDELAAELNELRQFG